MNTSQQTLTIRIQNKGPVELAEFTTGLTALADEYRRFIPRHESSRHVADADCRLYIKSVRSGSIEIDLVAMAPLALPFMENADTVLSFCGYLKQAYAWLAGRDVEKPEPVPDKANYENLRQVVSVVAKDHGAQINFITNHTHFHLDSTEARAVSAGAAHEIDLLKAPVAGLREQVVLYWYQARNTSVSSAGDRAIIESVSRFPVKTSFKHNDKKARMLLDEENPFKKAYVVNVVVESINDKPVLYTILDVLETMDMPESEG